jgi:peptidoglycan/LPS O-acetylase OafA/YrhL
MIRIRSGLPDARWPPQPRDVLFSLVNLSQQLGRVTSGRAFIPVVDGLRCVAILSVILYHLEDYLTHKAVSWDPSSTADAVTHRLLHAGHVGVPLFFALSGFILALPFYEHALGNSAASVPGSGRYYLRRLTRLEPPYLINLAIATVLLAVVNHVAWNELWPHLAASACYLHNQLYGNLSTINPVAWSLEIEVQFYLIAPWLARGLLLMSPAWRRGIPLALLIGLIALKMILGPYPPRVALSLLGTLDHFLAGILLADVYVSLWRSAPVRSAAWDVLSAIAWPAIFVVPGFPRLLPCLPLLVIAAYFGAFRGRITHRLLTWTPAVLTGGMCYTIYLYHFFVISAVGRFTLPFTASRGYLPSLAIQGLLIVPMVLIGCAVLFRLFERPFMAWRPWSAAGQGEPAAALRTDSATRTGDDRALSPAAILGAEQAGI